MVIIQITGNDLEFATSIVPLYGLPLNEHQFVHYLVVPFILSCIFVFVFPLILIPLFLFFKNLFRGRFQNGYLDLKHNEINLRKFFIRSFFLSLLTIGVSATLLNYNLVNVRIFLSPLQIRSYESGGFDVDNAYASDAYFGLMIIVISFVIGLSSVSWMMEDIGLMHYKLPAKGSDKLFEIEPVHNKYNAILRGYAGITAILFYFDAIRFYLFDYGESGGLFFISLTLIILMGCSVPGYIFYWKISKRVLKRIFIKNLKEIERITEIKFKISQ